MLYDIEEIWCPKGHCEVHPWIPEKYPCHLCYEEEKYREIEEAMIEQYEKDMEEYYEKQELEYYKEMAKEKSILFRLLYHISKKINLLHNKVEKYKEKSKFPKLFHYIFIITKFLNKKVENYKEKVFNKIF